MSVPHQALRMSLLNLMCLTYFVSRGGSMGGFFRANAIFTTPPAFGSMRTCSTLVTRLPGDVR